MTKRFVSICLCMLIGLGLGIASSEVLVRMFVPLSDFLWQWDPMIGMKLIPGKRGRSVKPGLYDVAVEVNSAGFRDRQHDVEKPLGVRRVALLGDSVVESLQVPFEDSFTPRIENGLRANGIQAEVINFGVSGAGTAREYLTLRDYALKYQPDLVFLFFVVNDFGDNTRELKGLSYIPYPQTEKDGTLVLDEAGYPSFAPFSDQPSRFAFLMNVLRDHSRSYRLLRETTDAMPSAGEIWNKLSPRTRAVAAAPQKDANFGFYEIYRKSPKPQWAKGRRVTEQLLLAARDLAAEHHVEFVVVLVPGAWEVYPDRWQEILNQTPAMRAADLDPALSLHRLNEFLAEHQVAVINLLGDFQTRAVNTTSLYFPGDGHWTVAGHQLAADIISRRAVEFLNSKPADGQQSQR